MNVTLDDLIKRRQPPKKQPGSRRRQQQTAARKQTKAQTMAERRQLSIFDRLGPKPAVRVSGLPYDVLENDLRELFGTVGAVADVTVQYDESGRSLGSASVSFVEASHAAAAVERFNGETIDGKAFTVAQDTNNPRRKKKSKKKRNHEQ